MEILINKKVFQCVVCSQDNKRYAYDTKANPGLREDDFALIKCFPLKENGKPDLTKMLEIYAKYLMHITC